MIYSIVNRFQYHGRHFNFLEEIFIYLRERLMTSHVVSLSFNILFDHRWTQNISFQLAFSVISVIAFVVKPVVRGFFSPHTKEDIKLLNPGLKLIESWFTGLENNACINSCV